MLWPHLKIWDWDWIFGRAVKAISSLGVRSPWSKDKALPLTNSFFTVQLNSKWFRICNRTIFCWDATLCTNLTAVADWQNLLCFVVKLHWTSTTPDPKGGIHKVRIFWEGHKILRNLHSAYFCLEYIQTKLRLRFCKILWSSQNVWNLNDLSEFRGESP